MGIASVSLGMRSEDRDGWVKTTPGSSVSEMNGTKQNQARFAVNLDISSALQADYRFDASKVKAVRAAIEKGTFSVDAEAIADKMLSNAQEILARSRG